MSTTARFLLASGLLACVAVFLVTASGARGDPLPTSTAVVHYLPFPAGTTYKVWQGNDQGPSHNDPWNKYAFDFSPMPPSSPICATADGTVVYVKEDAAGPTGNWKDNNEVAILHADGTVGTYLHLEKDGATVAVGDVVYAGDVIGRAGNTGKSAKRHLHFGLRKGTRLGPSVACRFRDVPGGVPKTGDMATSGNVAGRRLHEAIQAFVSAYDDASALDAREALAGAWKSLQKRPPRAVAQALEGLGRRADFVERWNRERDALLARHASEAEATRTRMEAALAAGDLQRAISLATVGRKEFSDLPEAYKACAAALRTLRQAEGYGDALEAARPGLSLRQKIVRALQRDLDTREKEARGKRVRWKSVLPLYDRALDAGRDAGAEAIVARLTQLRGKVAARIDGPR